MAIAQKRRALYLNTPLGADVLALSSFSGTEAISRLFSYQLSMVSETDAIEAKDIVGKRVTWHVQFKEDPPRYFDGFVNRFAAGGVGDRNVRSYRAEVVPWLWFLTRTANCKIFQSKSTPEIIQAIFGDFGFSDFKLELKSSYPKRDYCVQYRETAFNFVSRLMEEEGIFYFFQHSDGQHMLVLADQKSSYKDLPENEVKIGAGAGKHSPIDTWEHQFEFRSGKWARTDYNFETPATNLLTKITTVVDLPDNKKFELFDYPGDYQVKANGADVTKIRMEEEEVPYEVVTGTGRCVTFTPGGKFTLTEHDAEAEAGKSYVVTYIQHSAADAEFESGDAQSEYRNMFHCIPASVAFRPGRQTPKPLIAGAQTAVVVGPAGEEIYTDKYGRVKVQFFWDRLGKCNETSSCWIRVAQNWAGKNWGIAFHPRIGQEVIVDFLEGDPDRPLITGRVYNAEQMPPYELPANQTQSVLKTRSSKNGTTENFNELRFEDKKDSEEIYFHAEKDFNRVVENNDTLKVGFLKKDKGNHSVEIFNNDSLKVGCSDASDGSQTIEIYKDRTETVKTGNETVSIEKGNRTVTVKQGNDKHEVSTGNRDVIVSTGNDTHKIKTGNRDVQIDMGNDTLTIKMGNQTTKVEMGASSTEAMQSITLKVGQNSITIDQMGITLKGLQIELDAQLTAKISSQLQTQLGSQLQTQVQGTMVQVSGEAMTQISGGITMIG